MGATEQREVGRGSGRQPRRGLLTERDLEFATWIGRVSAASVEQLQARFQLRRTVSYRRLAVLREFRLVHRHRLLVGRPALYTTSLHPPRASAYEHLLALTDLVVRRELAGARMLAEQEIRDLRSTEGPDVLGCSCEQVETIARCQRIPDAVEVTPDRGLIAWEVELTSKGRARREQILGTYAASGYAEVRWVIPDRRLAELVRAEISQLGLTSFMRVGADVGSLA